MAMRLGASVAAQRLRSACRARRLRFASTLAHLTLSTALVLTLTACGGGSDEAQIHIAGAWARATAAGQTVGAIYLEIEADSDDTLQTIEVPIDVAAGVEVHETVVDDDASRQMSMREVSGGLPLPAGTTVALAPGGYHAMLIDLAKPLELGSSFSITLGFEQADDLTVEVPVLETAP